MRTSLGVAGHLVYTAGALAPLVIGELVENADKRWRLMRLVSVGTALAYETLHVVREERRNKEKEAALAQHEQTLYSWLQSAVQPRWGWPQG
jgi:hypothetical protein